MPIRNKPFGKAMALPERAKALIPGGALACAKGDDQSPEGARPGRPVVEVVARQLEYGSNL